MRKIIAGDQVYVIAGKDKGKTGRILKVVERRNKNNRLLCKVIVSGVNAKSYISRTQSGKKMQSKEFPIDISNVLHVMADGTSFSRIGFKSVNSIKKRYFKKSGDLLG